LVVIVVAIEALHMIDVSEPPTFVQIICAFVGSIVCLIGLVFLFSEGQILTKDLRTKKAPKAG
jgi:hypothetical protein